MTAITGYWLSVWFELQLALFVWRSIWNQLANYMLSLT